MWTYVVWFVVNNLCLDFKRRKSQRFLGKITTSVYVFLKIFVVHRIFISKLDGYKKFVFSITNFINQKLDFPASYKKLKIWGHRRWFDWGWCKIFCMKRGRKRNEKCIFSSLSDRNFRSDGLDTCKSRYCIRQCNSIKWKIIADCIVTSQHER